ncbi:MAG: 2'-5' RNA ligase family protein, partial [Bacteroidota bacterium]
PHSALRNEIRSLKEEIKKYTGAKKSLNSPAHITIQRPFRKDSEFEVKLINDLQLFAAKQKSFTVNISGFGCFEPRVIFIDVLVSKEIQELHTGLNSVLLDQLGFENKEINKNIHPHITIATRDLSKSAFDKVWPSYQKRKFDTEFTVKSIFLLKHNGKFWDVIQEFSFRDYIKL